MTYIEKLGGATLRRLIHPRLVKLAASLSTGLKHQADPMSVYHNLI